jgi:hypothetical protein
MWGHAFASRGRGERRLFPGVLVLILALVGLLLRPPAKEAVVYLMAMVLAFDMSLGLSGHSFPLLHEYVPVFHGLRAMARLGILVVLFLAVLGAFGYVAVASLLPARARPVLMLAICAGLLAEYRVRPLHLVPYPNTAPPLYAWLAAQPRGVVAEFPMPMRDQPGADPEPAYSYLSTFHWQPLVNGYSGFFPWTYLSRLEDVADFPDVRSIRRLRGDGVRYLVVHLPGLERSRQDKVLHDLRHTFGLAELTRLSDGRGEAVVFALR